MLSSSSSPITLLFLLETVACARAALTPQKFHLTSRTSPLGSYAARWRRSLSPVSDPLSDFFNGTDLQWFGNVSVGTPPQQLPVVFDTGSGGMEITSTLCGDNCGSEILFDPTISSTFVDLGRQSTANFGTCLGVRPVATDFPCSLSLRSGTDTVSIGDMSATNVTMSLITNETASFSDFPFFSGIVGMSATSCCAGNGVFKQFVDQGLAPLFGLFLTPEAVGNAELTLGGIDTTKFDTELNFTDTTSSSLWEITGTQMFVNGETTSILDSTMRFFMDSGTSNVVLPTNVTQAIYDLISPDIKPFAAQPGTFGIPCSRISTLSSTIDITFMSIDGTPFNLTIPSEELNVGPFIEDPTICQTLVNALDGLSVIGGSLLKHYYSVWDGGNARMGFAALPF